ncbi:MULTISPECIES: hypothetical protein [Vibrio]|uniref:hypothetical protein n=1 Tax=Vibrio TaxID=662 RepID=UPI001C30C510|nr:MULTISPECIES: hypothetical protein [Vibrio]MDQ2107699.1 hypothetical protein [Vibrio sp. 2017_1457_15]MDQ2160769.1 hypothetical protein [Vibrio sp. 2017_1457_13]
MKDDIKHFDATLLDNVELIRVPIKELSTDDTIRDLFAQANPLSGLRTSNEANDKSAYLFNLLSLQSPIICYRYRKNFKALTGVFTLTRLRCAIAQHHLPDDFSILVFVLKKKPSSNIKRSIVLFDLTNDLLSKCFISDTKKISFYLHAWFTKDEGKRSIYQSDEWQIFYPELNSADKVAKFLSISKADL